MAYFNWNDSKIWNIFYIFFVKGDKARQGGRGGISPVTCAVAVPGCGAEFGGPGACREPPWRKPCILYADHHLTSDGNLLEYGRLFLWR